MAGGKSKQNQYDEADGSLPPSSGRSCYENQQTDLASFTIRSSRVPVGGFPTGEAVQRVTGGGFTQSFIGALVLGPWGHPEDQLAHFIQIT